MNPLYDMYFMFYQHTVKIQSCIFMYFFYLLNNYSYNKSCNNLCLTICIHANNFISYFFEDCIFLELFLVFFKTLTFKKDFQKRLSHLVTTKQMNELS